MITGKTESGFEFELNEDYLDDYEMLEKIREIDEGNITVITDVVPSLLGQEQKERLKEHIRKETGKVSIKDMVYELGQILSESQKGKNS